MGFRAALSCLPQLLHQHDLVLGAMEDNQNADFAKAFDACDLEYAASVRSYRLVTHKAKLEVHNCITRLVPEPTGVSYNEKLKELYFPSPRVRSKGRQEKSTTYTNLWGIDQTT